MQAMIIVCSNFQSTSICWDPAAFSAYTGKFTLWSFSSGACGPLYPGDAGDDRFNYIFSYSIFI